MDEIVHYGGEEIKPGHKDEFDPNAPKGSKEDVPGKPGIKNPETGETVTPPVDDVTKYGPVDGDPIVDKEEIPYETKREFDKDLAPGTEKVVQKGENGETTTTPTTKNPLTNEIVDKGTPTEEITKKQWMKSYIMVAKKLNQAIKMNLIQTHRKVAKRMYQVNQVSKIQKQEKL